MQDRLYYAKLLGIEPEYIDDVVEREITYPSSVSSHFGVVHKVTVKRRGMEPFSLVEKISPVQLRLEREHKNADLYEAAVLRTLKRTVTRLPKNVHFLTPVFFDHRLGPAYKEREDRAIVTAFVPGTDLTEELTRLRKDENRQRRKIDRSMQSSKEGYEGHHDEIKTAERAVDKIAEVREAYIFLAVRALAEFHYYLKDRIGEEIKQELKRTNEEYTQLGYPAPTSLFDPRKQQHDFYAQRVVENLGELLIQLGIENPERYLEKLKTTNGSGRSPLNPIRALNTASNGNVITSDYRPVNLRLIIDDSLRNQIYSYIFSEETKDAEIQEKILDSGKIGIMDLGDLRIGPPLLDFADIICDPSVRFRTDKRREALKHFSDYTAMSEGELERAYSLFVGNLEGLEAHIIYKALKGAINTGNAREKRFYLETLRGSLGAKDDFKPLREVIRQPLEIMIETLKKPTKQAHIRRIENRPRNHQYDSIRHSNTPDKVPA